MRILLTNDDGWDAPGLATLATVMSEYGELIIVAPDRHLSGCSHQTTTDRHLSLTKISESRYHVDGTPADCVRLAVHALQKEFDWVISGVNDGGNMGVDVFMSGTVAAAREAALMGIPAMAVSQYRQTGKTTDWNRARDWTHKAIEAALHGERLGNGQFWSINLPDPNDDRVPQVTHCHLEPRPLHIEYRSQPPCAEAAQYQFVGKYQSRGCGDSSDVAVCFGGDIAVTRVALGESFRGHSPS